MPTSAAAPAIAPAIIGTSSTTTSTLPPTTTTMNYCIEENGMNQPLTITPDQVKSNPQPDQTTPLSGITPTPTTSGVNFPSPNPQINVTLNQPTTLTLIYVPADIPNNVAEFQVVFVYPNGITSTPYISTIPSTSSATTTTTPSAGTTSPTSTTPSSSAIVPPSDSSPQVDLPSNFQVPANTIIEITITATTDESNPTGVCEHFFSLYSLESRSHISCSWKHSLGGKNEMKNCEGQITVCKVESTFYDNCKQ